MPLKETIANLSNRVFAPDPRGLPPYSLKGIPGNVQRLLDDTAVNAGKKIWQGIVQSTAVGFGKGALIVAAIVLGLGLISSSVGLGFLSLLSAGGMLLLGAGGVLGSVMEIRQNQSQLSAEVAKAEAMALEATRLQKQAERSADLENTLPDFGFAAREMTKRDAPRAAMGKE
jgi:hypothetical protein